MASAGVALLPAALLSASSACGATPGVQASSPVVEASSPSYSASVAAIHKRKCGACHVLPEPGSRTREHLEDAFTRHQRRVHLTADEWSAMVDYMAAPTPSPALSPGATPDTPGALPQGLK
jgi:hypothetical protein